MVLGNEVHRAYLVNIIVVLMLDLRKNIVKSQKGHYGGIRTFENSSSLRYHQKKQTSGSKKIELPTLAEWYASSMQFCSNALVPSPEEIYIFNKRPKNHLPPSFYVFAKYSRCNPARGNYHAL